MPAKLPPITLLPIDTRDCQRAITELARWLVSMNVREEQGANRGVWVNLFLSSVSPALIGNPWCAAVQYWLHRQVGIMPDITHPALAADWFSNPARLIQRANIKPGHVIGFRVGGSERINHIELVLENRGDTLITAAGNTSAAGAIGQVVRDGDGFYQKARQLPGIAAAANWLT